MKEKILALLLAKFAGVRKDGLARLAGALALNATTDEEAGELVEKLTPEKVTEFVTDYRKDVDTEVSNANKTHEGTLKKKFEFVEKKPGDSGKKPGENEDEPGDMPAWAKALIESNNELKTKLSSFEGEKVKQSRVQLLEGKLKDVPETFKAQKLKDFGRMNFATDEDFNEYLTEFDTDISAFNQELADNKLAGGSKPIFGSKDKDGVSSAVSSFIADKTDQNKPLEGKQL